jgi:hypothetical protein
MGEASLPALDETLSSSQVADCTCQAEDPTDQAEDAEYY